MFEILAQTAGNGVMDSIKKAVLGLWTSMQAFLPGFIGGLVIFLVGCLIATIARKSITTVLGKMGLEKMSERIGLKSMLAGIGLRTPLPALLGRLVYWVLVFMFLLAATQIIPGLQGISQTLEKFRDYLPRLFSAVAFALAGLLVAQFVRGAVLTGGERMGLDYAKALANLIYGFLAIVIVTLAIGQMDIETDLLSKTIQIVLGSVALAFALALGFGLRPVAQNIAAGVYVRDLFKAGSTVTIDGQDHGVVSVGATSTRLEAPDGRFVIMPNSEMITTVVRGRA